MEHFRCGVLHVVCNFIFHSTLFCSLTNSVRTQSESIEHRRVSGEHRINMNMNLETYRISLKEMFPLAVKKVRTIYYERKRCWHKRSWILGYVVSSDFRHHVFTLFWFYGEMTEDPRNPLLLEKALDRNIFAQILFKVHMNSESKYLSPDYNRRLKILVHVEARWSVGFPAVLDYIYNNVSFSCSSPVNRKKNRRLGFWDSYLPTNFKIVDFHSQGLRLNEG